MVILLCHTCFQLHQPFVCLHYIFIRVWGVLYTEKLRVLWKSKLWPPTVPQHLKVSGVLSVLKKTINFLKKYWPTSKHRVHLRDKELDHSPRVFEKRTLSFQCTDDSNFYVDCFILQLNWFDLGARDFNVEFAYKPHIMKGHKSHY